MKLRTYELINVIDDFMVCAVRKEKYSWCWDAVIRDVEVDERIIRREHRDLIDNYRRSGRIDRYEKRAKANLHTFRHIMIHAS